MFHPGRFFHSRSTLPSVLLLGLLTLANGGAGAQPPSRSGHHFVVLVDDSKDMKGFRHLLERHVPDYLYEGEPTAGDRPRFDPDRDTLSVVFFAIHPDGPRTTGCPKRRRYSALPEHMFQAVEVDPARVRTKSGFREQLGEWLDLDCRFAGRLSPIATATSLVLPELGKEMPAAPTFARTILVNATNGYFNSTAPPGFELRNFKRIKDDIDNESLVRDTRETQDELQAVAPLFRFESPAAWNREYGSSGSSPFFINAFEAKPLVPTPESLLVFRRQVRLDRVAVSGEELRVDAEAPGYAELRIAVPEPARAGGRLVPSTLYWRFFENATTPEAGSNDLASPWRIGSEHLPFEEQTLDLESCAAPCRQAEGERIVSFLELTDELRLSSRDPVPRTAGVFEFAVTFRFDTGKRYDHLRLETHKQRIELEPVEPTVVPGTTDVLDNRTMTSLWRSDDSESPAGGLTQRLAVDRVLEIRDRDELFIRIGSVLTAVLLIVAIGLYFYRTAFHRPFEPVLEWRPVREVLVDFDSPAAGRLLAGTLRVTNPTEVPWFGQRLGNEEQPTREATLEIEELDFAALVLEVSAGDGSAIGFLSGDEERSTLSWHAEEPVSDGKRIYIFLAGEAIRDLVTVENGNETLEEFTATVPLRVLLSWRDSRRGELRSVTMEDSFPLRIRPEAMRPPEVRWVPASEKLHYQHDRPVTVGRFVFRSLAEHRYAQPFAGEYLLRTARGHRPLGGDPIVLSDNHLTLPARGEHEVPASIDCKSDAIGNPEPSEQRYEMSLAGPVSDVSQLGPYAMVLHRDPTKAEIDLRVTYQGEKYEFFWTSDDEVRYCRRGKDGEPGLESPVSRSRHSFERPFELPFSDDTPTPGVMRLQVGNTATSGRGWVKVNVAYRLDFDENYEKRLHFDQGYSVRDLLKLYDRNDSLGEGTEENPHFLVEEGGKPRSRTLKLQTGPLTRIDGARIPASKCRIEARLDVHVRDDQGRDTRRHLELVVPLELERLPGLNWLCIDFGTSAIAAAVGNCSEDSFQLLQLQNIKLRGDSALGNEDRENQERDTPFLPSWVICDGDLRLREPKNADHLKGWPEGYPLRHPASQKPGDPSFIGLPALSHQLRERPGRIIFSLKSWLGQSSRSIRLPEKMKFRLNGRQVHGSLLPLDEVVESSFAALTETYLNREPHLKADQVAICHPNTFTPRHKERLRKIAQRALMQRLDIAAPHHINLVSESDAVAYYYCSKRMEGEPRGGRERILVYDFGAGTLDISIIQIEWQENPFQPRSWTVEGRVGVPVAGNHVDELLARIIDAQLGSEFVLSNTALEYTYPLVGKGLRGDRRAQSKHRDVVHWTWEQIRAAKHAWKGQGTFMVKVGDTTSGIGPITFDQYKGDPLPIDRPEASNPAVWKKESGILLSLPADLIRKDDRMLEFAEFVTSTVVEEALFHAGVEESEVDTFLISGRGALWPVIHERLTSRFSGKVQGDLLQDSVSMKQVVTQGGIAFQGLLLEAGENQWSDRTRVRLGVLIGNRELVPEEEWGPDRPIDLSGSPTFRLVQIGLRQPDPRNDMKTLRRHFYIDLNDRPYRRDTLWRKNPQLYIEKAEDEGELTIRLRNSDGQEIEAFSDTTSTTGQPPHPPWPIGQILLDPK